MTYQDLVRSLNLQFPQLTIANSRPTSPFDENYNCIAWTANDTDHWWWPDSMGQYYWPPELLREESLEAFVLAYGIHGYVEKADASVVPGNQKVAIYTANNGKPTHAARQLPSG